MLYSTAARSFLLVAAQTRAHAILQHVYMQQSINSYTYNYAKSSSVASHFGKRRTTR